MVEPSPGEVGLMYFDQLVEICGSGYSITQFQMSRMDNPTRGFNVNTNIINTSQRNGYLGEIKNKPEFANFF